MPKDENVSPNNSWISDYLHFNESSFLMVHQDGDRKCDVGSHHHRLRSGFKIIWLG